MDTLACRLRVSDRVTSAGVQQTMIATCGARGNVIFFNQNTAQSAQCAVAQDSGSCCAAANDDHVGFHSLISRHELNLMQSKHIRLVCHYFHFMFVVLLTKARTSIKWRMEVDGIFQWRNFMRFTY
ncbi:Uncharacterised protein [Vibrio cholerae]|nr:Uncharacterised protein [Vibrio cholerae]